MKKIKGLQNIHPFLRLFHIPLVGVGVDSLLNVLFKFEGELFPTAEMRGANEIDHVKVFRQIVLQRASRQNDSASKTRKKRCYLIKSIKSL